jgi:hypothetical protein
MSTRNSLPLTYDLLVLRHYQAKIVGEQWTAAYISDLSLDLSSPTFKTLAVYPLRTCACHLLIFQMKLSDILLKGKAKAKVDEDLDAIFQTSVSSLLT